MDETNSLIDQRKASLAKLREKGIDPFKNKFTPGIGCGELRAKYVAGEFNEGQHVEIAGRITAHRDMGKSQFMDLKDTSGRIQIYEQKQAICDEQFDIFKHLDLADFIGVKGELFTTKAGEPSVKITSFTILAKALRPPPAKWHGLEDTEIRYRQRYLDLMANDEVKQTFLKRSAIVHEIRQFFHGRGYVEVETPAMQAIPGGAAAQPFRPFTRYDFIAHRAGAVSQHARGRIESCSRSGKFRNEGSRRHNPIRCSTLRSGITNRERLAIVICHVARSSAAAASSSKRRMRRAKHQEHRPHPNWKPSLQGSRPRESRGRLVRHPPPSAEAQRLAEIGKEYEDFEVTGAVFEKLIEPTLIQPTFVTHLPKELVPLAKLSPDDPTTVEVFECCINGQEIAPGYTEQNDPIAQRNTLEHQAGGEQQKLDEDFLVALEHGMPPAGGIGIGIDRLCMMLLGQESIRDVILFPQLKPK
jgi:lysyl-tRNA synthetase class 2